MLFRSDIAVIFLLCCIGKYFFLRFFDEVSDYTEIKMPLEETAFGERCHRFYTQHAPDKIDSIDKILAAVAAGKKTQLQIMQQLLQKYSIPGPEQAEWLMQLEEEQEPANTELPGAGTNVENETMREYSDSSAYFLRLKRFLQQYDKESFRDPYALLALYEGREEEMFAELVKFYGPEPKLTDFRPRLQRFIAHYAPSKLSGVEPLLEEWEGREEQLFQDLCANYGPEPDIPRAIPAPSPPRPLKHLQSCNIPQSREDVLKNFFTPLSTDGLSFTSGQVASEQAPKPNVDGSSERHVPGLGAPALSQSGIASDLRFKFRTQEVTAMPLWKMDDLALRFGESVATYSKESWLTSKATKLPVQIESKSHEVRERLLDLKEIDFRHPSTSNHLNVYTVPVVPSISLPSNNNRLLNDASFAAPAHPKTLMPGGKLGETSTRLIILSADKHQVFVWPFAKGSAASKMSVEGWQHITLEGAKEKKHNYLRFPSADAEMIPFSIGRAEYIIVIEIYNLQTYCPAGARHSSLRPYEILLGGEVITQDSNKDALLAELFWVQLVDSQGRETTAFSKKISLSWSYGATVTGVGFPFIAPDAPHPYFSRFKEEERAGMRAQVVWQQCVSDSQIYLQLQQPKGTCVHGIMDLSSLRDWEQAPQPNETYRSIYLHEATYETGPDFSFNPLKSEIMTIFRQSSTNQFIPVARITGIIIELCNCFSHCWVHIWKPAAKNFHPLQRIDFTQAKHTANNTISASDIPRLIIPLLSSDQRKIYLIGASSSSTSSPGKLFGTLVSESLLADGSTAVRFQYRNNDPQHCSLYDDVSSGISWDQVSTIVSIVNSIATTKVDGLNNTTFAIVLHEDMSSYRIIQLGNSERTD